MCDFGFKEWIEFIGVAINIGVLLVLMRHAKIFNRQANDLQESVNAFKDSEIETRKSRQQELRAYVHIETTRVIKPDTLNRLVIEKNGPNPPDEQMYEITFKNMGKTPAYDVVCIMDIRPFEVELRRDTILQLPETQNMDLWISKTSLGPDARSIKRGMLTRKITPEGLDALVSKKVGIYIYGAVSYRDAFGKQQRTDFRYKHFILDHETRFGDQLAVCPDGNDAT